MIPADLAIVFLDRVGASREDMLAWSGGATGLWNLEWASGSVFVDIYFGTVRGEVMLDGSDQGGSGRVEMLHRSGKFLSHLVIQIPKCCLGGQACESVKGVGGWGTSKNNKQKKQSGAAQP